jgi:hypothetical protein
MHALIFTGRSLCDDRKRHIHGSRKLQLAIGLNAVSKTKKSQKPFAPSAWIKRKRTLKGCDYQKIYSSEKAEVASIIRFRRLRRPIKVAEVASYG